MPLARDGNASATDDDHLAALDRSHRRLLRSAENREDRRLRSRLLHQGTMIMRSIMSLSSCSTMWQWCTYFCGLMSLPAPLSAVLGSENLARTTVTCSGFTFTVSFNPASSGSGAISADCRNGVSVETCSCGTPLGPPWAAT